MCKVLEDLAVFVLDGGLVLVDGLELLLELGNEIG